MLVVFAPTDTTNRAMALDLVPCVLIGPLSGVGHQLDFPRSDCGPAPPAGNQRHSQDKQIRALDPAPSAACRRKQSGRAPVHVPNR